MKPGRGCLLCFAALWLALDASAAAYFSRQNGNWTQSNRWSTVACGGAAAAATPGSAPGDTARICNGHTITLNTTPANAITTLTVDAGGVLNIGNNPTARTLTVTGNASNAGTLRYNSGGNHVVSIGGTLTNSNLLTSAAVAGTKTLTVTGLITNSGTLRYAGTAALTINANGGISNSSTFDVATASNVTHVLNVGADITNTGTFNLATDANSLANTTFNRNGNQTVSGAGATTRFNRITLNMGATNANILEITATNFSINPAAPTNFLTLTNGTFKYSTGAAITPFTAAPAISATRGFWLNSAATVTSGNFSWTVSGTSNTARGLVRVSNGTLNLGNTANNDLVTGNFSDIVFDGGTINIAGALRRSAAANDVRFNMSGAGTMLTVGVTGVSTAGNWPFMMESAASFTMSGGTIVIRRAGAASQGYQNLAATTSVTGGTLQIGDASTPAASTMQINSTAPVGNLTINSANATGQLQTNSLTVASNVTITAGTLNANNLNLTLGGNWSRTGTFTPGTGTVTFNGTAAQGISGATTFNSVTISNTSAAVTANAAHTIGGTLTLNGSTQLADGGNTITANGNVANSGTHSGAGKILLGGGAVQQLSGSGTYANLEISNGNGATLTGSPTINGTLTFTNGDITTGSNTLTIASTGSVSGAGTASHVVGNVAKGYSATGSFTYPLGDGTNYTPILVNMTSLGTAGNLTASVTNTDHPNSTATTSGVDPNKSINRYWTLKNSTLAGTASLTLDYIGGSPVDNDSGVTVANFRVRRGATCSGSGASRSCTNGWSSITTGTPSSTTASTIGVSITGGASESDLAVGEVARFAREKEFIYSRERY